MGYRPRGLERAVLRLEVVEPTERRHPAQDHGQPQQARSGGHQAVLVGTEGEAEDEHGDRGQEQGRGHRLATPQLGAQVLGRDHAGHGWWWHRRHGRAPAGWAPQKPGSRGRARPGRLRDTGAAHLGQQAVVEAHPARRGARRSAAWVATSTVVPTARHSSSRLVDQGQAIRIEGLRLVEEH